MYWFEVNIWCNPFSDKQTNFLLQKTFSQSNMKLKNVYLVVRLVIAIGFIIITAAVLIYQGSKGSEPNLTFQQEVLLAAIKLEAKEAGLRFEEVEAIGKTSDPSVCYDIECFKSAFELLSGIDFRNDPCDPDKWLDFVCTRRIQGKDIFSRLDKLQLQANLHALEIVQEKGTFILRRFHKNHKEFLLKEAKTYFGQCVRARGSPLNNMLAILDYSKKFGLWPTFNSSRNQTFPWMDFVADQNRLDSDGFSPLFIQVGVLSELGTQIVILPGRTSLSDDGNEEFRADFNRVAKRLGPKFNLAGLAVTTGLYTSISWLDRLNHSVSSTSGNGTLMEELTIEQLQNVTDLHFKEKGLQVDINWARFFERVLAGTGITVGDVLVPVSPILTMLEQVQLEMSSGGGKAVRGALQWNLMWMLINETSSLITEGNNLKLNEQEQEELVLGTCLKRTIDLFGYSLGKTYLNRHYDSSVEPSVRNLMDAVKEGYMEILESPPWMGTTSSAMNVSTKEFLQDKVRNIKFHIAQPGWMREPGKLETLFEGLAISSQSSYVTNFVETNMWGVAKRREWKRKVIARIILDKDFTEFDSEWNYYLGRSRATYFVPTNAVSLTAGFLQKRMFDKGRPGFMNYGSLGTVLGHEIGHSLVKLDGSKQFGMDFTESWAPTDLQMFNQWLNDTAKYYDSIPNQYSNFKLRSAPGGTTVEEDASDILGLQAAFRAYERYLADLEKEGKKEKGLPGLSSFTPQQLFFVQYANNWCSSPKAAIQLEKDFSTNEHSPPWRRADIPLRLSGDFKKAFKCK